MTTISLPHEWTPRPYQKALWEYLSGGGKRAVAKWHRRAGKDEVFLHHTACAAHERVGNYWYMLPEYSQARKSMWDAIDGHSGKKRIDRAFPQEIRKRTLDQQMMIEFHCGSTFQLVGSDNFNSLVGSPPVGLVFSEYAISQPSSWGYLMPILEENGGWAGFNSTPRGKNHFKRLCEFAAKEPGWFFSALTADQSGVFTQDQLQSILRQLQAEHGNEYGMALYMQEYHCSFEAAMPGSIWGDCIAKLEAGGRVQTPENKVTVPHTEGYPVFTGWDLGFDDDTTCWFYQVIGDELCFIDYVEDNFKDIEFYATMLLNKYNQGYRYGIHWLPHDARPRTIAAGGKSILQQFIEFNKDHDDRLGRFAIAPRLDKQEQIQAARATFPHCRFDGDKCEIGIDHLKAYRREFDEENNVFSTLPKHDGSSHAADGFTSVAVTWRRSKMESPEVPFSEKIMANNVVGMRMGQIRNDLMRSRKAERDGYA